MLLKHSRGTATNRVCAARGCSPREMASYKGCWGSEAQLWKLPKLCRCAVGKQPIRTGHGLIKWNPESCDFRGSLGKPGQDKDWLSTVRKELRLFENHRGIAEPAGSLNLRCFDKLRTLWLPDFMKVWGQGNATVISWVVLYLCSYFYCREVHKIQGNRSKLFMLS